MSCSCSISCHCKRLVLERKWSTPAELYTRDVHCRSIVDEFKKLCFAYFWKVWNVSSSSTENLFNHHLSTIIDDIVDKSTQHVFADKFRQWCFMHGSSKYGLALNQLSLLMICAVMYSFTVLFIRDWARYILISWIYLETVWRYSLDGIVSLWHFVYSWKPGFETRWHFWMRWLSFIPKRPDSRAGSKRKWLFLFSKFGLSLDIIARKCGLWRFKKHGLGSWSLLVSKRLGIYCSTCPFMEKCEKGTFCTQSLIVPIVELLLKVRNVSILKI